MPETPNIEPDSSGNIDLATLVEVLADNELDVVEDRTNYAPTKGRVIKETPSGTRYLGDGDQWIDIDADGGFAPPSVRTESQDITKGRVIRAKGANGNWVETFDPADFDTDHDALNAARDAIKANGNGGVLKLGLGIYDLYGPFLTDQSGIKLEGTWIKEDAPDDDKDDIDDVTKLNGTILRQNQAGANCITVTHEEDGRLLFNMGYEDFILTWEESIRRSDTGHGIHIFPTSDADQLRSVQEYLIDHVHVHGNDGDHFGFDIHRAQGGFTDNLRVEGGPAFRETTRSDIPTGNSHHRYCYAVVDVADGSEPIYEISGNINFVRYDYLQYYAKNDGERNAPGWRLSPNGNVNDVCFGILDAEDFGKFAQDEIGYIENMRSMGLGVSNPLGTATTTTGDHLKLHDGSNPHFTAYAISEGVEQTASLDWQITRSGATKWNHGPATRGAPDDLKLVEPNSPNYAADNAKAYFRLNTPNSTPVAGDTVEFVTEWNLVDQLNDTAASLRLDILRDNGNGMAVQLASENTHGTNGEGRIRIHARCLEDDPFPVDVAAEVQL